MGAVWSATHLITRKHVGLKFLKGAVISEALLRRFLREARAASAVNHPNVLAVHDVIQLPDGLPVMVMDLLHGESLAERLARARKIPLAELAQILVPVISAVGTAHAAGIVHRDLKPDNIFLHVRPDGEAVPKVLDFRNRQAQLEGRRSGGDGAPDADRRAARDSLLHVAGTGLRREGSGPARRRSGRWASSCTSACPGSGRWRARTTDSSSRRSPPEASHRSNRSHRSYPPMSRAWWPECCLRTAHSGPRICGKPTTSSPATAPPGQSRSEAQRQRR